MNRRFLLVAALGVAVLLPHAANSQGRRFGRPGPPTLGLESGTLDFDTPDFTLKLVKASQTVAALQPKGAGGFDFTPADRLGQRASDGFQHLGDLSFRVRKGTSGEWQECASAAARKPVTALTPSSGALTAADLSPTLPADSPLQVTRTWTLEGGRLALRFALKNRASEAVQVGALGFSLGFNNIITGRNLKQAHETCSFSDPYVGQDAGYVQVTRLSGGGPALLVVPEKSTPLEAYRPLREPMFPGQTFEGMFEWTVHSQAYAENEWNRAQPWNPPTSATLKPGETRTYGLRFVTAPEIRKIEDTLAANARPVAVGIPGYILPMDQEGKLFLRYGRKVVQTSVDPPGALAFRSERPTRSGWKAYTVQGKTWGRVRLTITYDDGTKQAVHYVVTKPAAEAVADLGRFLTTKQWFVDPNDPFHRSPGVISYDREADKQVAQDSRVWIAGMGDEGGSGSWLAAAMKEFAQPNREELAKYEQFVDHVLWGGIQYKDGPNKYAVRKSLFFYEPALVPGFTYEPTFDWRSWTSWNKRASEDIGRGYNYPHVVAAYWSLYRVARNHPGLVKNHPWEWYLNQAYETTRFTFSRDSRGRRRVGWVELGLMEGSVFLEVLKDLQHEGWSEKATEIEQLMRERALRWSREEFPFGSEMAWDSTGQEEVYAWCKHFGYDDKALVSLNAILGYMPTLPHWGYNGNARRYWDFLYGGKLRRIERQLHHYGSGLNAIPVLSEYRQHPDDLYLLRVGYGGSMGALSNIDRDGFASAAFHSFPDTLKWDPYSGDYGPNFFGHALNAATYVVNHPEFGWQAFGGNVSARGEKVTVLPKDSMRSRIYIAPYGLWLTLDAGAFDRVEIDARKHTVRLGLVPGVAETPTALLRIEQPAKVNGIGHFAAPQVLKADRGGWTVPLKPAAIKWIELRDET